MRVQLILAISTHQHRTSIVGDVGNSPANASKPMIGDTIKRGQ